MARIVDKDTRIIDMDFGPINLTIVRAAGSEFPTGIAGNTATYGGDGSDQILRFDADGIQAGSFIQFQRIDLDYMTLNNEVMQPMEVSVQRTVAVPEGTHQNGNNYVPISEFLFVFSRPLNNEYINGIINPYLLFEQVGLARGTAALGGEGGGVSFEQNIYAEQRIYQWNQTKGARQATGELTPGNGQLNTIFAQPSVETVNTWGSLSAITGPTLYVYRVWVTQMQSFEAPASIFANVAFGGVSTLRIPPVSIAFLCKDPKYTEGEYLTRLANAMANTPTDGEVA